MPHSRALVVVLLLTALAVAGVWLLQRDDASPVAPPSGPTAAQAGDEAGASAAATVAGGTGTEPETSTRVAAPTDAGAGGGASGACFVGQVLDEQTLPIAGAIVTCTPGFDGFDPNADWADYEASFDSDSWRERMQAQQRERTETTTDGDGRFRLAAGGKSRNLSLRVRAPSHVVLDKGVQRPVGKDSDLGVLTLKNGAAVSGRVLDRAGSPVVGARVSRESTGANTGSWDFGFPGLDDFDDGTSGDMARTDAEGRFAMLHCAAGRFALRARHADHPSACVDDLAVEPGGKLTDVLIVAEPGASIRGRIVGLPEGMKPLLALATHKRADGATAGPEIVAYNPLGEGSDVYFDAGMPFGERQVRTNPDFTFELRGLSVGKTYRVWAAQTGRGFAGNSTCTEILEVASGTSGLELRYDPGITVSFQVVAARTGEPIERLAVRNELSGGASFEGMIVFAPGAGRTKSYPEGKVTIANLRPKKKQTLRLTVEALGFQTYSKKEIALPITGALDLGIVKLEPAPVLQVTVTSGPGRRAVAGANVRVLPADRGDASRGQPYGELDAYTPGGGASSVRTGKTDDEGRLTLNALSGAMVVSITSKEFAPYRSEPITLRTGESGSHDVALVRGGIVEVTVVDSEGAVLKETRVENAPPTGNRSSKSTNLDGVVVFERLVPGEHGFRIGTRGGGYEVDGVSFAQPLSGERKQPVEPGWQKLVVEDGGKATLRLAKGPMATLRGIVRENGVPLAGARVAFVEGAGEPAAPSNTPGAFAEAAWQFEGWGGNSSRSVQTGDDGTYQLKDLPAGAHRLRITAKGRVSPTQVALQLRQGENVVDVDLDVTIVRGTVRDSAGKPVAGATVSVVPATPGGAANSPIGPLIDGLSGIEMPGFGSNRSSIKSGDDGRYELRGVQAGKPLRVRASAKGHAAATSANVEVAQGTARDGVDIELGVAGRITVSMAEAPMFTSVQARLLGADGEPDAAAAPVVQMLQRGTATLDGLRPGRWKVTLTPPGGEPREPRIVDVVAGETVALSF